MEMVHQLEKVVAGWFKQAPHLPKGGREWLGTNVWWLVIIGVVLGAMGIFSAITLLAGASLVASSVGAMYGVGGYVGMALTATWVSLGFSVVMLVLEAMAISPLKNKQKKGWDLLFLSMLLSVVGSVLGAVLLMNPFGLVGTAIGFLIGGYLLFEIHDQFTHKAK